MTVHDVAQGGTEWFAVRRGRFTGSNFDKLFMAKSTKGYGDLINGVVFERITGVVPESFESDYMRRGTELEPIARQAYELETFRKVELVGFVTEGEWIGASPDGLLDDDGILEIKCPKWNTFIAYALDPKKAVSEYEYQIQGELMLTGRNWVDLFVYHPNMEPLTIRVERNEETISAIRKELEIAIRTAQERIIKIKGAK